MKKLIFVFLCFLSFTACKSQTFKDSSLSILRKTLLTQTISDFSNNQFYNQTINDKILWSPNTVKYNNYKELIKNANSILPITVTYNAKSKEDKINFNEIFNKEELNYMSRQINDIENLSWQEYLGFALETDNHSKKKIEKEYFFSMPVFTREQNYALLYQEEKFGGTLVIYRRIDTSWQAIGNAIVWVN